MVIADSGENGDSRGNGSSGVDHCLEGSKDPSATNLDRSDLGYLASFGASTGCFEIQYAECDFGQGSAEVIKGTLGRKHSRHAGTRTEQTFVVKDLLVKGIKVVE